MERRWYKAPYIRLLFVSILMISGLSCHAQTHFRIHHSNGGYTDVPLSQVDSITFVDGDSIASVVELKGSWFWGSTELGYYELLTFNDDHTYTGYDNYFTYGFDTMTYGWWGQMGAMLTLQSNGFGYQRRYNWFIMGLSENALEVMTKMGSFTYYRLQPEVITLQAGGEPLTCSDGDSFIFADGVVTTISDNKLQGIAPGVTYIQKHLAANNSILSYKVIVE